MPNQPKDSSLKRLSGIKEGFARLLSPESRPVHRVIRAAALDELDFDSDEEEEEEEKEREEREREMQMTDHPSTEIQTPSLTTGTAVTSSANRDDAEPSEDVRDGRTLIHRGATTNMENVPSTPVVYSVVFFFTCLF